MLDLGGNPEYWFSCDVAHLLSVRTVPLTDFNFRVNKYTGLMANILIRIQLSGRKDCQQCQHKNKPMQCTEIFLAVKN